MMSDHSYSALDRHAVLSGSDDGFPWYAGSMLAMEAGEVVCLRMEKFANGEDCEQEARLMVVEKIIAAFEAGASWFAGASVSSIVGRYREQVADNARRLSA